jgi:hypothetical protein
VLFFYPEYYNIHIHTYHSRFIPERVTKVSQIFLRDIHVLPKLAIKNTADVTGGKPIAVLLQSISGVSAINPLVAFTTSMEERGAILLFCPGHHTSFN